MVLAGHGMCVAASRVVTLLLLPCAMALGCFNFSDRFVLAAWLFLAFLFAFSSNASIYKVHAVGVTALISGASLLRVLMGACVHHSACVTLRLYLSRVDAE